MLSNFAQITGNGASNAADFQPETRNPQTAPGLLQNQSQELQSGDQSTLLDNGRATISVPDHPDAAALQAAPTAAGPNWLLILLAAAGFVLAVILFVKNRRPRAVQTEPEPIEVPMPYEAVEDEPKPSPKPASKPRAKKPVPKKSKSKRKKRARR